MISFKKMIYKKVTEDGGTPPVLFFLDSTRVDAGVGTLDIIGGEPNEVIDLHFEMGTDGTFASLQLTLPVDVEILDNLHLSRDGTMTLDSSGSGSSNYDFFPTDSTKACLVTVTARSSGLPEGIGDFTNII